MRSAQWWKYGIATAVALVWLAVSGIGGPYFGKISEVVSSDQATFLPASAESTKVKEKIAAFQDEDALPAIIVFTDGDKKLDGMSMLHLGDVSREIGKIDAVTGRVSPPIPSEDGKAALLVANVATTADEKEVSAAIRSVIDDANLSLEYAVGGAVGFLDDLSGAFAGIDGILLGVALAVVFVILLIVYRSPFLPFVVLCNSVFALCGAILLVFALAKAGIIALNGQVQGILFILVIGAATDYSLLFISRYREELTRHASVAAALMTSIKRSFEPIVAAGGTVIAGLLCLLLSDLNSNKALGPVGSIGIVFAIIATFSFLPSVLLLIGRRVFWPRIPYNGAHDTTEHKQGLWQRVGALIARAPRRTWVITTIALLVCTLGVLQLRADGVSQSDFVLGESEARTAQQRIDTHFPGGAGAPAQVIVPQSSYKEVQANLREHPRVANVVAMIDRSKIATPAQANPYAPIGSVKVVDGTVLLEVTLKDGAESEAAQTTVEQLRADAKAIDSRILIGGTAATQLDTKLSSERDRSVVIPAVLVVITVILMLLLRSILAPILLLLTTILSFGAILGVSALVFNHIFGFAGADPSVVLYAFIFLVALGIDYNIFLMTRVREESLHSGTHKGVVKGLVVTGSVITSAGIVLAATFAALSVIPILFLLQLAFIVAFGVLLDTIIVRSLLVPALTHDIGNAVWWPSRKFKK